MTRGRKPTPNELKVLQGGVGKKVRDRSAAARAAGEGNGDMVFATTPAGVPAYPTELKHNGKGRRYWRIYWRHASSWLAKADYPAVVRLCRLHDMADDILRKIDELGMFRYMERGDYYVANPLVHDLEKIYERIERTEASLGLNPVERSRIRVQVKEQESSLDAWLSARNQK